MPVKITTVDDVNPEHQAALRGFGKRVLSLRQARRLSQADLAALIGAGRGSCALWETAGKIPDLATICRLAECLNVSANWLALGVGPTPTVALALEERCVEVPVFDGADDETTPFVVDARLARAFGLVSPTLKTVFLHERRNSSDAYITEFLIVDASKSYLAHEGRHVFEGSTGVVRSVDVRITGSGPVSVVSGAFFPIDPSFAGRHLGLVVLRGSYS